MTIVPLSSLNNLECRMLGSNVVAARCQPPEPRISEEPQRVTLYYREGGSDKIYQVTLAATGTGYIVNFAFGRRGSTLQTGSKTASPVAYTTALKIYHKLVQEKMAKGYTPGETGQPYQQTVHTERNTGILPQLLNPIEVYEIEPLLTDPRWLTQEKMDGRRVLIQRDGEDIIGINRKGLTISLPQPVVDCAKGITSRQCLLDGECISDMFIVFDLLEQDGQNLRGLPYRLRLDALYQLRGLGGGQAIRFIRTAIRTADKRAMLADLRRQNAEGIVFKRIDASYTPGRPASGGVALKYKFTVSASCLVAAVHTSKRSVMLEVFDAHHKYKIPLGNVTIPPDQAIPGAGSIVEVRYLYAYPQGALCQPVYLGTREDIPAEACDVGQLKFKAPPGMAPDDESESPAESSCVAVAI